ncbi:PLD nuclease N-terminal domain-containing protein [Streptomyces chrestomyceticus]|uniref:PLD nuclease N-terminal domain-containing protein n=1 Tax=Streptomyces chrestomyceticus TaxID=68185 RepID=UPI00340FE98A
MKGMMRMSRERLMVIAADGQYVGLPIAVVVVLLILAAAGLYISALISIITSPAGKGMKFVWIVFAFIAPFIGSALWFFVGRRHARSSPVTF